MKEKTLLEKAKEAQKKDGVRTVITPELIELAVAWANGGITLNQVNIAMGYPHKKNGKAYITLARALALYVKNNPTHYKQITV